MAIVAGFDVHRAQITFEPCLDAIVEVALDAAPGRIALVDKPSAGRLQLGDFGDSSSKGPLRAAPCDYQPYDQHAEQQAGGATDQKRVPRPLID